MIRASLIIPSHLCAFALGFSDLPDDPRPAALLKHEDHRLRAARERFDVVILDPPAFIKRKKDIKEGTAAYQRLNRMAIQVLAKDGILISSSCSHPLHREALREILLEASRHLDRFVAHRPWRAPLQGALKRDQIRSRRICLAILEEGRQAPDHPVHPAIPETAYLKAFFARVLPS